MKTSEIVEMMGHLKDIKDLLKKLLAAQVESIEAIENSAEQAQLATHWSGCKCGSCNG